VTWLQPAKAEEKIMKCGARSENMKMKVASKKSENKENNEAYQRRKQHISKWRRLMA